MRRMVSALRNALRRTHGTGRHWQADFSTEQLAALSPQLAARAKINLIETTNAVPTGSNRETRGMVVHSASPVTLANGEKAALVGGILRRRLASAPIYLYDTRPSETAPYHCAITSNVNVARPEPPRL